jgi:hypothetical protein
MLNPYGSELAHERACDRQASAEPRRRGPGRVRTALGSMLLGAGARLTRSVPERSDVLRRAS